VQHLHGWLPGGLEAVEAVAGGVIRAYQDIGMRVSYSFAFRDQNRLVYRDDQEFTASLPADLQSALRRHFARFGLSLADYGPLFEHLRATHHDKERVKIQLQPANLHWCSDAALEMLADLSARHEAPMHMYLVETAHQKEYARRRGGSTALDYIDRFGFLGPRLTPSHRVWLNEADLDRIAATGTHICHNCSLNFRLRSGVARSTRLRSAASIRPSGSTKPGSTTTATCCRKCCAHTWCEGWRTRTSRAPARYCAWRQQAVRRPLRLAAISAPRGRQGRRPRISRLGQSRLPLSRPGDHGSRRGRSACEERRG
jgi:hypothetical protein